jgi:hypothetical protein
MDQVGGWLERVDRGPAPTPPLEEPPKGIAIVSVGASGDGGLLAPADDRVDGAAGTICSLTLRGAADCVAELAAPPAD